MRLQRRCALTLLLLVLLAACTAPPEVDEACTGDEVRLRRDDTITLGADLNFPPFAFRDPETDEATGFEVELARLVATDLDLGFVVENRASAALVTGAIGQRHDLAASGLRDIDALAEQACLSVPYLEADLAIAVPAEVDARAPEGASDIPGYVVGVVEGTTADSWTRSHLGETPSLPNFDTTDDLLDALERGAVDAAIDDEPLVRYALQERGSLRVADVIDLDSAFVFLTASDNGALMERIDGVLEAMRNDGRLATLQREWFGQEL